MLFTLSAWAEDCYFFGHPGVIKAGKCTPIEKIGSCSRNEFRCDETLFGDNLCVNNDSNILMNCYKKSYQNRKRFDGKPSYLYFSYLGQIEKIIEFCLDENNPDIKESQCQDLLLIARESKNYFYNHTEVVETSENDFLRYCQNQAQRLFPWLDIFLPETKFVNKNPYPAPKIEEPNLEVNPKGDFCLRDMKSVDTLVLHHTGTFKNDTLEEINDYHISHGWYKVGYNFIYNPNQNNQVFYQTRNPFMNGSHAGAYAYSKTKTPSFKPKDLACFTVDGEIYPKPDKLINPEGYVKANSTSIGLAIMGNFAPFDPVTNPTGYQDHESGRLEQKDISEIAKLMCHLQGRYPSLKYLKKHDDYKDTICPGDIEKDLSIIIKKTKELGCDFSL